MKYQTLYTKQLALCAEIDAVIELSNKAQSIRNDEHQFLRQVSLLFNRIHVLEAIKHEAALCALEAMKNAARETV